MRNKLIVLVTAILVGEAHASDQRVLLGTTIDGTTTYLMTSGQMRRANKVTAWFIKDFGSPEVVSGGHLQASLKVQQEYDCKERETRLLYIMAYSEKMAQGIPYLSSKATASILDNPNPIVPGSSDEVVLDRLCKLPK